MDKTIEVYGRRWFNSREGNTYHSVTVSVNGEEVGRCNYAYGYDDGYKRTAMKILQDSGKFPEYFPKHNGESLWRAVERNGDKFISNVHDVERKKYLSFGD